MFIYWVRPHRRSVTPRPEGSMRGNRCMSLDEPQLPETHPRTRKAFSTIARLKNGILVLSLIKSNNGNLINQTKILPKIRQNPVCNKDYPCQETSIKTFILNVSILQWDIQAIKNHNSYQTYNHENK